MAERLLKESPKPDGWWSACLPRLAAAAVIAPLLIWLVTA